MLKFSRVLLNIISSLLLLIIISKPYFALADKNFFTYQLQGNQLLLSLELDPEEHIYWLLPGDSGLATTINFTNSQNLASAEILWPFPEKIVSYGLTNYVYQYKVRIPVYLSAINPYDPVKIQIQLNYAICSHSQCIPKSQQINFTTEITGSKPILTTPDITNLHYDNNILQFTANNPTSQFIITQGAKVLAYGPETMHNLPNIPKEPLKIYSSNTNSPLSFATNSENLLYIILTSMLGGFILNFMPCVLPVVALKIFSFTNLGKISKSSIYYTIAGIITSYLTIGLVTIWLKSLSIIFGLGINFQQPEFIIILAIIMTIFASYSINDNYLQLPAFFSNIGLENSNAPLKSFLSGVLATLFSTPCTAPFIGTAISFAMTANKLSIIAIFLSIALGFSLPYFLLLIAPNTAINLNRAKPYMYIIKRILAAMMILTVFWLVTIIATQLGPRAAIGFLLILLLLKFTIEHNNWSFIIKLSLVILLSLASLNLTKMAHNEDIAEAAKEQQLWQQFSEEALEKALAANKIIVVDITAEWCLTCQYNKLRFWHRDKAIKLLTHPHITCLRSDMTNYDAKIQTYLAKHGVYGIPFNIIYGPHAPQGIILPITFSYAELVAALKKAGHAL